MTNLKIGSDLELAELTIKHITGIVGKFLYAEGKFWFYENTEWKVFEQNMIRQQVYQFDGASYGDKGMVRLNNNKLKSIIAEIEVIQGEPEFFYNPKAGVNCLSGFVEITGEGATLIPHDPSHACRHTIQAKYHGDRSIVGSRFEEYLNILRKTLDHPDEMITLFEEIAGAVITGFSTKLPQPKAFILVGRDANNGKSSLLELFRSLVPDEAVSVINPGNFKEPAYAIGLVGKLLNTSDELSSANAIASDRFKAIITGNPIEARDLYKSVVRFKSKALNIFAAQRLPGFIGGLDKGVRRRVTVIQFVRPIPEKYRKSPQWIQEMLTNELDIILAIAIKGAIRLIKNNAYTIPDCVETAVNQWVQDADCVRAWTAARWRLPKAEESTDDLWDKANNGYTEFAVYKHFKEWAETNGGFKRETIPGKAEFLARFGEDFPQCVGRRSAQNRHNITGGCILMSDWADENDGVETVHYSDDGELSQTIEVKTSLGTKK